MDYFTLSLLALVALVAGFVDAVAGGGGLLCVPALLLSGLDPVSTLATNKLQGTFGTASATYAFWKKGTLKPSEHILSILTCFAGAALGVAAVSYAPTQALKLILPPFLILIALYFILAPKFPIAATTPRLPMPLFVYFFGPLIAFYDGIFGPGTGSFFMLALVTLFGLGLVEATGRTKLFNLTSNSASLLVFAMGGKIVWITGLVMGVGQLIGAQLGARLAIKNGAMIIRPLLVFVCLAMAAKLIWAN